jgi:obg-like ATPase 1
MAALVAAAGSKKGKKGGEAITAPKFGRVKSNLKMGILGLPNVGKSSFFNLITSQSVAAENYPICTIEHNESICAVPDKRFEFLSDLFKPPSKICAYLSIIDIAGIIRGASEGAGLGNAFLSHIQSVDGLFHVVRAFDNPEVIHVDDSVDPIRDMETIVYELCRKDQAYVLKAKEAAALALRKDPKKKFPDSYFTMMEKVDKMLAENMPLRNGDWTGEEVVRINESVPQCITLKPIVYLVNLDASSFKRKANKWLPKVNEWVAAHGGGTIIPMSVEWEQELWDLKQAGDEAALDTFIKGSAGVKRYYHIDLGHFLRE